MKPRNLVLYGGYAFYALLWLGGVVSHVFLGGAPADAAWAAPVFLGLAGLLVLGTSPDRFTLLSMGLAGFTSEVIGVRTGIPFGPYFYTDALGPKIAGVSVVIGAAWIILLAYVRQMTSRLAMTGPVALLAGALWMTAIDLVIDPLAAHPLSYWEWLRGGPYYGIPTQNFLGWFAVSYFIFRMLGGKPAPNGHALGVGATVILFFTLIAAGHKLWLASAIGVLLLLIHLKKPVVRDEAPIRLSLSDPENTPAAS